MRRVRKRIASPYHDLEYVCDNGIEISIGLKNRKVFGSDDAIAEAAETLCEVLDKKLSNFILNVRLLSLAEEIVVAVRGKKRVVYK